MKRSESILGRSSGFPAAEAILPHPEPAADPAVRYSELNEKLIVAGRLTRHDLLNKLTAAIGYVYLARQEVEKSDGGAGERASYYLQSIEEVCGRMSRILDIARVFENSIAEKPEYIKVEETLRDVFLPAAGFDGVTIELRCGGLSILADSLLGRIFFNLLDNTIAHGGGASEVKVYTDPGDDGRLDLVYEDNGSGIPSVDKERIFHDGVGNGTGLGLFLVGRICAMYGWTVKETGEHGKGARFVFSIPEKNSAGEPNCIFRPSILN